jgi:hypothetical protein
MYMASRNLSGLILAALSCAVTVAVSSSVAQAGGRPDDQSKNWFGDFSGGWAFPEGNSGDILDDDWTISGGATYWPSDWAVGINFGVGYSKLDISDDAIRAINAAIAADPNNSGTVDGGDIESWQFTINAIWGPGSESNGLYFTGGVGAYSLDATVTETGLVYYPPFCDPWYWWWCYPGGVGLGSIVAGSDSTTEIGYNLGLGYSLEAGDGQFFIEAKYHLIDTETDELTYVPLTFGFRW